MKYALVFPFLMGTLGNIAGGYLSDFFSNKFGLKIGRRILGVAGLVIAAIFLYTATSVVDKVPVIVCLSLGFGFMDLMLPSAWAVCHDIGGKYSGTIAGAMNTSGNIGGFICAIVFGYIVKATHNYNYPLIVISIMVCTAAVLFMFIDASKPLAGDGEE
jgi:nitrate/nitrite transporter NarK